MGIAASPLRLSGRSVSGACAASRMENPTIPSRKSGYLILLLLKTRSPFLIRFLEKHGYDVFEARSADHLVALSLSNQTHAVIVDVCLLGEIEGWSVAHSVKMVKRSLPVLLLCHGPVPERVQLPTAVDAIASDSDLPGLLKLLELQTLKNIV